MFEKWWIYFRGTYCQYENVPVTQRIFLNAFGLYTLIETKHKNGGVYGMNSKKSAPPRPFAFLYLITLNCIMDIVNFFRHIGFCCIHVELSITIHNLIYTFCITFVLGQLIWLDWSFKSWLFWDNTWNLLLVLSLAELPGVWPRLLSTARDVGSVYTQYLGLLQILRACSFVGFSFSLSSCLCHQSQVLWIVNQ